jgi:large subunit ribosomal protein L18
MLGTAEKPRLSVFRSNRYISAQIIDDLRGNTLVSASSNSSGMRESGKKGKEVAALVGKALGEAARKVGIEKCFLDRGRFKFHGQVKALADAAREAGLKF